MSFAFWQRWLVTIGPVIVCFGLALAVFNQAALSNLGSSVTVLRCHRTSCHRNLQASIRPLCA
jgi:hypothetical protein